MTITKAPLVEPLANHHDRNSFHCGEPALDDYIRHRARQDLKRRIATVFVAVGDEKHVISGYYTLNAASLDRDDLPDAQARKLPRYPVPCAIIGRLAIHEAYQGRFYGKFMLFNALDRIVRASENMAVHAVLVDARNDAAKAFYEKFGFQSLPGNPMRLFIPLKMITG